MTTQLITLMPGTQLAVGSGSPTIAMNTRNISSGAARQSAKYDLGAGPWPAEFAVRAQNILGAAAAVGARVDYYVGWSNSGTAATDNSGGCSGADAAYSGQSGGTIAQSVIQLQSIGSLVFDANIACDMQLRSFEPKARYMYFVMVNNTAQTTTNVNDTDNILTLTPMNPRLEAAA